MVKQKHISEVMNYEGSIIHSRESNKSQKTKPQNRLLISPPFVRIEGQKQESNSEHVLDVVTHELELDQRSGEREPVRRKTQLRRRAGNV